jgi:hypothetical protein
MPCQSGRSERGLEGLPNSMGTSILASGILLASELVLAAVSPSVGSNFCQLLGKSSSSSSKGAGSHPPADHPYALAHLLASRRG